MSSSGPTPGTPQDKIQELINRKLSAKIGSTPSPTVPCSFSGKKREFLTYASRRNTHSNFFESPGPSANGALQQTPTTPTAATMANSVGDPSESSKEKIDKMMMMKPAPVESESRLLTHLGVDALV